MWCALNGTSIKPCFFRTLQLNNWELLGLSLFNVKVEIKGIAGFLVFYLFSEHVSCCLKGRVFLGSGKNQEKQK